MSRQKYDGKIQTNFLEAYTVDEILDIENFNKMYDFDSDLYKYTKIRKFSDSSYRTYSSTLKRERPININSQLANIYVHIFTNDTFFKQIRESENYLQIFKILNLIYNNMEHLDITKISSFTEVEKHWSDAEIIYYDSMNYLLNRVVIPIILDYFNFRLNKDNKTVYYLLFNDLQNGTFALLNNIFKYYVKPGQTLRFIWYNQTDTSNKIATTISYLYNKMTLEQINMYKPLIVQNSEIFQFFNVEYDKEMSLFNPNASVEDKSQITTKYTSMSSIKALCNSLIDSFTKTGFDAQVLISFIDEAIINNKKIRDTKFPTKKYTPMFTILKMLFISNRNSRKFLDNANFSLIIDRYHEYFYNPYFIAGIFMKKSVLNKEYRDCAHNTLALGRILFSDLYITTYMKQFIKDYFDECEKDKHDRKSTYSDCPTTYITYGLLDFLNKEYADVFQRSYDITDIRQFVYKTAMSAEFLQFYRNDLLITNPDVKEWRDGSYSWCRTDLPIILKIDHFNLNTRYSITPEDMINDYSKIQQFVRGQVVKPTDENYIADYNLTKYFIQIMILELVKYITTKYAKSISDEVKKYFTIDDNSDFKQCQLIIGDYFSSNRGSRILNNNKYATYACGVNRDYMCYADYNFASFLFNDRVYKNNKEYNLYNISLVDDAVFIPKFDRRYYGYRSGQGHVKTVYDAATYMLNYLLESDAETLKFYKPIFIDNFNDDFKADATMKSVLGLYMVDNDDETKKAFWREDPKLTSQYKDLISTTKDFYIDVLYPRLLKLGLITEEEIENIRNVFIRIKDDYDCYAILA